MGFDFLLLRWQGGGEREEQRHNCSCPPFFLTWQGFDLSRRLHSLIQILALHLVYRIVGRFKISITVPQYISSVLNINPYMIDIENTSFFFKYSFSCPKYQGFQRKNQNPWLSEDQEHVLTRAPLICSCDHFLCTTCRPYFLLHVPPPVLCILHIPST